MLEEIRTLRLDEMEECLRLSMYAFQYELTGTAKDEALARLKPEQFWGFFVEGKLAAKMSLLPLHINLQGKPWAMGGIASVASWPEYRRKGLVGRLLQNSLGLMKEQGQTLSFLHPFKFEFYRKFGWETFTDYKQYELEVSQFPRWAAPSGTIRRIDGDVGLMSQIYDADAIHYNGTLRRDVFWWKERILRNAKFSTYAYFNEQGNPRGYVSFQVMDSTMNIHELIALDEEARRGLWQLLGNHDSMITKATMKAPADDAFAFLLNDPRIKQSLHPYFMARVVDVPSFLRQYKFAVQQPVRLGLQVQDPYADWNEGLFVLTVDGQGKATVDQLPGYLEETLQLSIQAFTALFMGYQRPATLHRLGLLSGESSAVSLLEQIIPKYQTCLRDFF